MKPVCTKSRVPVADMRIHRGDGAISCWSVKRKRFYTKVPEHIRFWSKVNKTETCWLWTAGRVGPYGTFDGDPAHSWIAKNVMNVEVSHKMVIDHICRNQLCVRPDHLRFVSQRVNLTNGSNRVGKQILQTHCKRGHPLSGENCYLHPTRGHRHCRACAAMRQLEYTKRQKEK